MEQLRQSDTAQGSGALGEKVSAAEEWMGHSRKK